MSAPPRLATALMSWSLPPAERTAVLGDLEESFAARRDVSGDGAAAAWYWRQTLRSIVPNLVRRLRRRDRLLVVDAPIVRGLSARRERRSARGRRAHLSFRLLATATLSLALAVNLVVFAVADAIWLRPRPVAEPGRLVIPLSERNGVLTGSGGMAAIGFDQFLPPSVFDSVAGQIQDSGSSASTQLVHVSIDGAPPNLETLGVTANYFATLGVRVLGRDFTAADDTPGAVPVAIVSDRLWRGTFGGRADVLGSMVHATPVPVQVVGVAPDGFRGVRLGEREDVWIPEAIVPRLAGADTRDPAMLIPIARLRHGVSLAQAQEVIARTQRAGAPFRRVLVPADRVFGNSKQPTVVVNETAIGPLVALMAAFVLIAGSATLMALTTVHLERRRREFATRLALGGSRARLVSLLGRELAGVAAAGVAGALLLAGWALRVLPAFDLPGGIDLSRLDLIVDWRVVAAGIAAGLMSLIGAAALPVARASRPRVVEALGTGHATDAPQSAALRRWMLALDVAATTAILVLAGLFVDSAWNGTRDSAGFDAMHDVFVNIRMRANNLPDAAKDLANRHSAATFTRLLDGLRGLPGVTSAAVGFPPIGPDRQRELSSASFQISSAPGRSVTTGVLTVSPDYFDALGMPLLAGRPLTSADAGSSTIVVTRSLAGALFPDGRILGQLAHAGTRSLTIAGVVSDVAFGSIASGTTAAYFEVEAPAAFTVGSQLPIVVRTDRPDRAVSEITRLASDAFPDAARIEVTTGGQLVQNDLGRQRLAAWFFSGFGSVTILLGICGVFGLVAYAADSRRRDLGIRMALGATPRGLIAVAIGGGLIPVVLGAAAGLLLAATVAPLGSTLLVGIESRDLTTYAIVFAGLVGSSALAALIGAWRIQHVDPIEALRAE